MDFKTIETYSDAADIIREYYTGDVSDEILDYLEHVNDFDAIGLLVVNGSDVIMFDTINGHVYGRMTLDEFMQLSIDTAKEEIEND